MSIFSGTQFALLSQRRFLPLFLTQFFGALNDNVYKNGLMILLTFHSVEFGKHSPQELINISAGLFVLPFVLLSSIAGQLADKYEKTFLIRLIKLSEVAIMILVTIALYRFNLMLMISALVLLGVHSTFFGPIKYAILPQHLYDEELVGGNALVEAGTFLAILLGTIIGGVLIMLEACPHWMLGMIGIGIGISGYITSLFIPKAAPPMPSLKLSFNIFSATIENMSFILTERKLLLATLGISWFWLFGAFVLAQLPMLSRDLLDANEEKVTMLLALFSLGIGVGSLLCEKLSGRKVEIGLVLLGLLGMTIFTLDLFFINPGKTWPPFLRLCGDFIALGLFGGFFMVPLYTLLQKASPLVALSRVVAANNIINSIFMVLAAGLSVLLVRLGLNINEMLLVMGLGNGLFLCMVVGLVPEIARAFKRWVAGTILWKTIQNF